MIERSRRSGLLMTMLAMSAMGYGNATGIGRDYQPTEPTPEQKRQQERDAQRIQQLQRFVIGGKEVFARNKKDALKRLKKK